MSQCLRTGFAKAAKVRWHLPMWGRVEVDGDKAQRARRGLEGFTLGSQPRAWTSWLKESPPLEGLCRIQSVKDGGDRDHRQTRTLAVCNSSFPDLELLTVEVPPPVFFFLLSRLVVVRGTGTAYDRRRRELRSNLEKKWSVWELSMD